MLLSRIGLGRKRSPWPSPEQKEASFDVCCREVCSIHEWETLEEYCYQLAACLRKVFRAERTALFRMDGETLLCRGSCNLSGSEIASGMFVPSRDLIRERIREEAPLRPSRTGWISSASLSGFPTGTRGCSMRTVPRTPAGCSIAPRRI